MADLSSAVSKFEWACQHYETLERKIREFDSLYPYAIDVEPDPQAREYLLKVRNLKDPLPEFTLLAGDCLFNLRASLDHLVCALWLGDCDVDRPEFPVYDDVGKWSRVTKSGKPDKGAGEYKLREIPSHESAIINGLQPCNGRNSSDEVLAATAHNLWLLHNLNIIDKHRRINPIRSAWHAVYYPDTVEWIPIEGPLKNNAPIGRFHCVGEFEVNVHTQIAIEVAVMYEGSPTVLLASLWSCVRAAAEVLARVGGLIVTVPAISNPELVTVWLR